MKRKYPYNHQFSNIQDGCQGITTAKGKAMQALLPPLRDFTLFTLGILLGSQSKNDTNNFRDFFV